MTIMIPRFLTGTILGIIFMICLSIMMLGQSKTEPIKGTLKKLVISWIYKFFIFWFQAITNANFVSWNYITPEDVNFYQEWLGPKE